MMVSTHAVFVEARGLRVTPKSDVKILYYRLYYR